jgi:thioredoxin 1
MQTTLIITGIVTASLAALYLTARSRMKNIPDVASNENILTLTDKNFQHQTKNKLVLVDFWASWCAPCRMMAPVLNEVADELNGNSHVGKVDIEQYQSLAQKYQVRNIPTLILLKNGVEVNRFVGIKNKEFLLQQINNVKYEDYER